MHLKLVLTPGQSEVMRQIRNSSCEYMTRYDRYISSEEQQWWYLTYYLPNLILGRVKCYILCGVHAPIGYGLVRIGKDTVTLTGAIHPSRRGEGWGEYLFFTLMEYFPHYRKWLEVKKSNKRAYSLYKKLGFKKTGEKGGVIFMETW